MKKKISTRTALIIVMVLGSITLNGQDIRVTFTGTGAVTQIDSIKATNITTDQSVTFPGNETLVLTLNTGTPSVSELIDSGIVYPNPFLGKTTLRTVFQQPQTVELMVQNLVGRVIAKAKAFVQPGENEFALSLETAGIYIVTLTTEEAKSSYKMICSGAATAGNSIQYLGVGSNNFNTQNNHNSQSYSALKSLNSGSNLGYTLGYTSGDIIKYLCRSTIHTTVIMDSLINSKNYEVEFVACTDPFGKNYSIVPIGDQTWMAENLAYLPAVSPSSSGSDSEKHYYVYGYTGTSVSAAMATTNYTTYGVMYNWEAAKTACPTGWHLPSDGEWKILEKYLGMSESDANTTDWRYSGTVGGKLKESGTTHWLSPNTGATNSNGFMALPGGNRLNDGGFYGLGSYGSFWSSSENGSSSAWLRYQHNSTGGAGRHFGSRRGGFSVRCLQN